MIELRVVESGADVGAYLRLRNEIHPRDPLSEPVFAELQARPRRLDLVAELDGAPAGIGSSGDHWVDPDGPLAFVNVRVLAGRRRRGVGGALLRRLGEHARLQGRERFYTVVAADDRDSLEFFGRRGYERVLEMQGIALDLAHAVPSDDSSQAPAVAVASDDSSQAPTVAVASDDSSQAPSVAVASDDSSQAPAGAAMPGASGDDSSHGRRRSVVHPPVAAPPGACDTSSQGLRLVSLGPELDRAVHDAAHEIEQDLQTAGPLTTLEFDRWRARQFPPHVRRDLSFALLDGETVAGYAILEETVPGIGEHAITGVRRAYRGRGLARALKQAQIAAARAAGFAELRGANTITNLPMRALNEGLGYRQTTLLVHLEGPLP